MKVSLKLSLLIAGLYLGVALCSNAMSESDRIDNLIFNGYVDQKYFLKLWKEITLRKKNILLNKKGDEHLYWNDLNIAEEKLVEKIQSFYLKKEQLLKSTDKKSEFEHILKKFENHSNLKKIIDEQKIEEELSQLSARIGSLESNLSIIEAEIKNYTRKFGQSSIGNQILERHNRIFSTNPLYENKSSKFNESEKLSILEIIETHNDYQAPFIIGCLKLKKTFKACSEEIQILNQSLDLLFLAGVKRSDVLTLVLAELSLKPDQKDVKDSNKEGPLEKQSEKAVLKPQETLEESENSADSKGKLVSLQSHGRYFLSTSKKCGGLGEGRSLGFIYSASAVYRGYEGDKGPYFIGKNILPLYNCIRGDLIITSMYPNRDCEDGREHIIGFVPSEKRINSDLKGLYKFEDTFQEVYLFENPKTKRLFYDINFSKTFPKQEELNIKIRKESGFKLSLGKVFTAYKKTDHHLYQIYRCLFPPKISN